MSSVGNLVANFTASTGGFTKPVAGMQKQLAGFVGMLKSSIGPLAAIALPVAGAFGLKHVVESAREASGAAKKFQAVLDATGGAAGITTAQMQDFASSLQKTTNFEDDATTSAAALLATFTNIRGDVFKRAITSAMDFATITGQDLPAAISLIGKALNDPINGMMKLRKAGIQLTEEQKRQVAEFQKVGNMAAAQGVILDAMAGRFGGAAEAMASPFKQIENIIGDISENIGFLLLPSLKEAITVIQGWISPLQDATDSFKQWGEDAAMVFRNIGKFTEVMWLDFQIEMWGTIPELSNYVGDFMGMWVAGWKFAGGGFDWYLGTIKAGVEEISNVFQALFTGIEAGWDALISGDFTKIAQSMTIAIDAAMKKFAGQKDVKLPGFDFDKLADEAAKAGKDFTDAFNKDGGILDDLTRKRDALIEKIGEEEGKRPPKKEGKQGPLAGMPEGKEAGLKGTEAAVFGSKEAFATIFGAMRTKGDTVQDKLLDAAERTAEATEEMTDALEEMASNSATEFIAVGVA